MQSAVRVGLIGLGKMGQNHLRVLSMLKSVDLAFVFDLDADAARRAADAHGTTTDSDVEKLLPLADAVVICTPTVTHADYVRKAARHVSTIFVEKPLAHTLQQTEELAQFAQAEGLNLQVGFIERFNPAVQQLKSVLDEAEQVISIDFARTNKLSARITDVDVVTDLMIHDIDLALYLNGPVTHVSAHGLADGPMINFASAMLTHANGRFSRIQASRVTEKKMRMIQATCADMFINCELLRKELLINRQSEIQQKDGGPYTISAIEETVEVRQQEALLTELQSFVSFCRSGDATGPGVSDAVAAAAICDEIQRGIVK
jgi:predicted dehydrogenase